MQATDIITHMLQKLYFDHTILDVEMISIRRLIIAACTVNQVSTCTVADLGGARGL